MAILLLIPFFIVRFWLLGWLDKTGIERAAHFAPMYGGERIAFWAYQISTMALVFWMFRLKMIIELDSLFGVGAVLYATGLAMLAKSVIDFAAPAVNGFRKSGLYCFTRNPMYVSYFVFFLGCVLLTRSFSLFLILLCFQVSGHWVILAEERWCLEQFGEPYSQYLCETGRYL